MRGLIYKENCLFIKGLEKRSLIVVAVVVVFLMAKAGNYAGLMASIMLALAIGIQGTMSFACDEKADWKKYQMALPLNSFGIVASKYISAIYMIVIGICGSVILNLLSSLVHNNWDFTLWGLAVLIEIIIPLLWLGICLPLTYWFGYKSSQMMGMICIFPMVYLVKFFEDGPGLSAFPNAIYSYLLVIFVITIVLYILSFLISVLGYSRKI